MSEPLSTDPYKGVRDFYPSDWARLEAIFAQIRKQLSLWGYEEYNASPLERAELYEAKTSEEIVSEQTYTFTDRGDRRVTLRPEMTPTLARMIAGKRRELVFPLRWFSIPNVFRYERPQKGRLREHYQVNVDLVGVPSADADEEIVALAFEIMKSFGADEKDFVVRMNSRSLLTCACSASGLSEEATRAYLRVLDKKNKMTPEAFLEAVTAITDTNPLELIEAKDVSSTAPEVAKEKEALLQVISALEKRGVGNIRFDPTLTRGFDYYTGIVFEIFDTNAENPRALFGGGRFDRLVELFGGESLPAVGFGMGDVTLSDFLETHTLVPDISGKKPNLYVGTPLASDVLGAQLFADKLRKEGVRVFVNLSSRPLGGQVKDALNREIPHFVAYGADEEKSGEVRLKTLATSEEKTFTVAELIAHLRSKQ